MANQRDNKKSAFGLHEVHNVMALIVLALLPITGVMMSIGEEDWTWFARSGAGIVALAVWLFARAYFSDARVTLLGLRVSPVSLRQGVKPSNRSTEEERIEVLEEQIANIEEQLSEKERELSNIKEAMQHLDRSLSLYIVATYSAMVGTVIWGFGDLVGLIF